MDILRCMNMFFITKILDLAYMQNYMHCLSQNKSDTKLFRVYLSVSSRLRGLRATRDYGVLMVKILNKCILSILVYNLFFRQTAQYFILIQRNNSIHRYIGCLHEIEIQIFKRYGESDWTKK